MVQTHTASREIMMIPEEYVKAFKRYVHELHGDGAEAKVLLKHMETAWKEFNIEQQREVCKFIFDNA